MKVSVDKIINDASNAGNELDKVVVPTFTNNRLGEMYSRLTMRARMLVDSVALGIPFEQIYHEYFDPYHFKVAVRNTKLQNAEKDDIQDKYKIKLVAQEIQKCGLGPIIQYKRNQINDIYIEEFRKKALSTHVGIDFLQNELLKLRDKTKELKPELQVKYELQILQTMDKVLKGTTEKSQVTNIQINNNMPEYD